MTIRRRIILIFTLAMGLILSGLVGYINWVIKPENMETVRHQSTLLVESKASEVGMWLYRKIAEFRVLAQVPAFKSADVRGIAPLIENLTESFKLNGDTMETFAYGGINGYSGFNWVNADAILDLIVYEDYVSVLGSGEEYAIGTPITTPDNRTVILIYYPIKGYNGSYEGLICSAIPTVRLKEIVDPMDVYGGKTWIMNRKGTLLTSYPDYFYKRILGRAELERIGREGNVEGAGSLRTISPEGRTCTLFYAPVPYSRDWVFCALVDNDAIFRSTDAMLRGLVGACSVLLALSILLGLLLARSVEAPIRLLQGQMDLVEGGDLGAYFRRETKDEIYYLGNSYNRMLDEINNLIKRIYEEQGEKRRLELQVLQGQIKPHFLYNTLDNVKWMAKEYGAEDIARTVTALSTFFRVFLSEGEEEITLEDEFRHTRSYLEIQQIRYGQLLSYEVSLEGEIAGARVVKIIVQPLVENAIYHGIKNKRQKGHISVSALAVTEGIAIVVSDDGIGMDASVLAGIRASIRSASEGDGNPVGHYGLRNIAERLRLAYGAKAGIDVESVEGEGTRVTMHLPRAGEGERQ